MLSWMETQASPAEELPALYRSILDGVLELERLGHRREAVLVRAEARDAYSASWDEKSRRRLLSIRQRIDRLLAGRERPRDAPRSLGAARRPLLPRA
jgi:hypothetical protein